VDVQAAVESQREHLVRERRRARATVPTPELISDVTEVTRDLARLRRDPARLRLVGEVIAGLPSEKLVGAVHDAVERRARVGGCPIDVHGDPCGGLDEALQIGQRLAGVTRVERPAQPLDLQCDGTASSPRTCAAGP
jgi:hypothetical protein